MVNPQIDVSAVKPPRVIARRMAVGFALVSAVAVTMCVLLISLLANVSGLVMGMQRDEAAIKGGLALATSVREQYMHQAHWIIERNDEHLEHYAHSLAEVRAGLLALRPLVPVNQEERLKKVAEASRTLDTLYRNEIMPAVRRGAMDKVARLHNRAEAISRQATEDADAIASSVEARMALAHTSATHSTRLGLIGGAICVVLVLLLSVAFTFRLRRAVLKPLDVIAQSARRFGAGDFDSRVGEIGEGELLAVAHAFDHMAAELEEREKRLIESERMAAIGQLAAGVAHEINNPIQVIRGYLKTMSPDSNAETLVEELAILDEEAAACQRIAEDLVAYSRTPDLQCGSFQVAALLEEAAQRFGETPEGKEHRVAVDADEASVDGDRARLRQVVLNLLVNAAQVSDRDKPINVIGRNESDDGYSISVLDRGPGIAKEDRQRVFEPFFSKRADGSGLGLAVCQGIVRAHGGTIEVRDRDDGGAVIRVVIPYSSDREASA